MRERIRRTILPMTSSLGCASTRRRPIRVTLSMRPSTSCHLDRATTCSRIWAVATAHGSDPRICLLLSKLRGVVSVCVRWYVRALLVWYLRDEVLDGSLQWLPSQGFEIFLEVRRIARSGRWHFDVVEKMPLFDCVENREFLKGNLAISRRGAALKLGKSDSKRPP